MTTAEMAIHKCSTLILTKNFDGKLITIQIHSDSDVNIAEAGGWNSFLATFLH